MESNRTEFLNSYFLIESELNKVSLSKPLLFSYFFNEEIVVGTDIKKLYMIHNGLLDPRSDVDVYLDDSELTQALMRAVQRYLPGVSSKFHGVRVMYYQNSLVVKVEHHLPPEDSKELIEACKLLCEHDKVLIELPTTSLQRYVFEVRKSPINQRLMNSQLLPPKTT